MSRRQMSSVYTYNLTVSSISKPSGRFHIPKRWDFPSLASIRSPVPKQKPESEVVARSGTQDLSLHFWLPRLADLTRCDISLKILWRVRRINHYYSSISVNRKYESTTAVNMATSNNMISRVTTTRYRWRRHQGRTWTFEFPGESEKIPR